MTGSAVGGIDFLYGGNDDDRLYGDAFTLRSAARGGSDTLNGDSGRDTLYGDAR